MEKIFALYDSDLFYATRFMEYLKKRKDFNFEVAAFTKPESFFEFLQEHQIEILLLESKFQSDEIPKDKVRFIYQLSEEPNIEKDSEPLKIFKYQSAGDVISVLISDYNQKESKSRVKANSKPGTLISVFSPGAGIETLSFTWSLSTLMSERQKVLFVRLDLLPVQLVDQYQNSNPSLSEFIYYLKTNEDMIEKMRELIVVNGNLSYLTGISHGSDILSLNKEEIQKWIEGIKNHSDYQTIIFYLENLTDAAAEVINLSESVLVTAKDTAYENLKIKEWQRQMECMGINMNADKFQFIRLQEEKTEMLPISMNILTHSYAWSLAEKLVNS